MSEELTRHNATIHIPVVMPGGRTTIQVRPRDLYNAVEAAYDGRSWKPNASEPAGPSSEPGTSAFPTHKVLAERARQKTREPAKGDQVRIKGTEHTGQVVSLIPDRRNRLGRVNVRVPGYLDEDWGAEFSLPPELVEVIEHPDVTKAAEAIVPLMRDAGATFGARSIDDRRNIVREVLKVVAPDHPALRE